MTWRPITPDERWQARHDGLYSGPEQQLTPDQLATYADALDEVADAMTGERAAWHLRDLVLNAGDDPTGRTAGGAEAVLPTLRALRRRVGRPSVHGRRGSLLTVSAVYTLYRGGPSSLGCSWTDDARIARTYARSDPGGREQHPEAPVWTLDAPARAVLAVVPVAGNGGPDEFVLDPAEVDLEQATRAPFAGGAASSTGQTYRAGRYRRRAS